MDEDSKGRRILPELTKKKLIKNLGLEEFIDYPDINERIANELRGAIFRLMRIAPSSIPESNRDWFEKLRKTMVKKWGDEEPKFEDSSIRQWFGNHISAEGAPIHIRDIVMWITEGLSWRLYLKKYNLQDEDFRHGGKNHRERWGTADAPRTGTGLALPVPHRSDLKYFVNDVSSYFEWRTLPSLRSMTSSYFRSENHDKLCVAMEKHSSCLIFGEAGAGKTTLAAAYGIECKEVGMKVLYLSLTDVEPEAQRALLAELQTLNDMSAGVLVIIDDCHLRPNIAYILTRFAAANPAIKFVFICRHVPKEYVLAFNSHETFLYNFTYEQYIQVDFSETATKGIFIEYLKDMGVSDRKVVEMLPERLHNSIAHNYKLLEISLYLWKRADFTGRLDQVSGQFIVDYIFGEYLADAHKISNDLEQLITLLVVQQYDLKYYSAHPTSSVVEHLLRRGLITRTMIEDGKRMLVSYSFSNNMLAGCIFMALYHQRKFGMISIEEIEARYLSGYLNDIATYIPQKATGLFLDSFHEMVGIDCLKYGYPGKFIKALLRNEDFQKFFFTIVYSHGRNSHRYLQFYWYTYVFHDNLTFELNKHDLKTSRMYWTHFCVKNSEKEIIDWVHCIKFDEESFEMMLSLIDTYPSSDLLAFRIDYGRLSTNFTEEVDTKGIARVFMKYLDSVEVDEETKEYQLKKILATLDFSYLHDHMVKLMGIGILRLVKQEIIEYPRLPYLRKYLSGVSGLLLGYIYRVIASNAQSIPIGNRLFPIAHYFEQIMEAEELSDFAAGVGEDALVKLLKSDLPEKEKLSLQRIVQLAEKLRNTN